MPDLKPVFDKLATWSISTRNTMENHQSEEIRLRKGLKTKNVETDFISRTENPSKKKLS
jgi:hypothetical protein